ncbi:MAG: hypothetical protein JRN23_04310 [Nitrososphaerota archaeon]|nr:hypothetical protein [Nitrososphaerota archaeon]
MTIRITVSEIRPSGHRIRAFALEYAPRLGKSQATSLVDLERALEKFIAEEETA